MFLWLQRFPWHDAVLGSGEDHGCEKCLTESLGFRYAQNRDKIGFFRNMTPVLPRSDLVEGVNESFAG